ncbi:peptidylprolyl isomerase [Cyanobacteria bacterium FACHB-502]|uniref:peptidylprolyl isomerase n=1 Tax=Leptolyngbya sp. GB1-A1 TaxID=2933908 RepID=UPI0019C52D60|nr:peptidylprolyl isomerase [Cyanobacteria bacterium FACHB-502]
MTPCLRIGSTVLSGDQLAVALTQFQQMLPFVEQILLSSYLREVKVTKQELHQYLTGRTDLPEDFDAFFANWLKSKKLTPEEFQATVYRSLLTEKLKYQLFQPQLESEFMRCKPLFDQVEFSRILVRQKERAEEIYFQLRDEESTFPNLASLYSEGEERHMQGWVGPLRLYQLPQSIARIAYQDPGEGQVYPPVQVGSVYWIIRIERFAAARFTEVNQQELRNRLFEEWLKRKAKALMNDPTQFEIYRSSSAAPATDDKPKAETEAAS